MAIDVSRAAFVFPSLSSLTDIPVVINETIVHDHAIAERAIAATNRWVRTIRHSEAVIVNVAVDWHHRTTRHQGHVWRHT
jgi:hypothetical protein